MDLGEVIALAIVALAALYLLRRMTGWPRLRPKPADPGPKVILGPRLAARVEERRPPPPET